LRSRASARLVRRVVAAVEQMPAVTAAGLRGVDYAVATVANRIANLGTAF
jgi:hypothetical protein